MAVIALMVYLDYKKKMAMTEQGIIPEDDKEEHRDIPENIVAWRIAILGIGISLLISWRFNLDGGFSTGLIFISIGIGLLVSYLWKKTKTNE